jgi:ketosteroid isomerase-like protein
VRAIDHDLGDALGQAFVELTFRPEDKEQALKIVIALEQALREDIEQLDWMTPPTKKESLTKLFLIENRIGYPDKWQDYSSVTLRRNDWTSNTFRASEYAMTRKLNQIGKPVDRSEWEMTPPTVNMYAHPQLSINVPAGNLAPPFYETKMDAAVKFGGIGAGMGHELTHQFDDLGHKFDAHGNLRDWWTPDDSKQFENRAKCVSNQYSGYTATGDIKLNGDLTLGENLADASGLRVAYMALKHKLENGETRLAKIDGFTPEQRLFLSYGLSWCGNLTPELLRDMASSDPHSPPQYRVNGVVWNMPEFQQAFGCKKGQPMVRENACRVWCRETCSPRVHGDLMKRFCQIAIVVFGYLLLAVAQSSTATELIELENRFNEALLRGDIAVIEEIEANDLIFTDATGVVTSKAEEIQSIKSGEVKFASIKMTDIHVQDYGNVGVVTGSLVEKAQYKNADISGTYRFTDVWAKRKGKWEHVAGQETLLSTPAEPSASGASDVADVKATLATLINFQLQYDAAAVDKLLDPDFVYVSNDGSVVSRAEFIKLTDREKNPLDLLEVTGVQVRTSGDTAVATGTLFQYSLSWAQLRFWDKFWDKRFGRLEPFWMQQLRKVW